MLSHNEDTHPKAEDIWTALLDRVGNNRYKDYYPIKHQLELDTFERIKEAIKRLYSATSTKKNLYKKIIDCMMFQAEQDKLTLPTDSVKSTPYRSVTKPGILVNKTAEEMFGTSKKETSPDPFLQSAVEEPTPSEWEISENSKNESELQDEPVSTSWDKDIPNKSEIVQVLVEDKNESLIPTEGAQQTIPITEVLSTKLEETISKDKDATLRDVETSSIGNQKTENEIISSPAVLIKESKVNDVTIQREEQTSPVELQEPDAGIPDATQEHQRNVNPQSEIKHADKTCSTPPNKHWFDVEKIQKNEQRIQDIIKAQLSNKAKIIPVATNIATINTESGAVELIQRTNSLNQIIDENNLPDLILTDNESDIEADIPRKGNCSIDAEFTDDAFTNDPKKRRKRTKYRRKDKPKILYDLTEEEASSESSDAESDSSVDVMERTAIQRSSDLEEELQLTSTPLRNASLTSGAPPGKTRVTEDDKDDAKLETENMHETMDNVTAHDDNKKRDRGSPGESTDSKKPRGNSGNRRASSFTTKEISNNMKPRTGNVLTSSGVAKGNKPASTPVSTKGNTKKEDEHITPASVPTLSLKDIKVDRAKKK